MKRSELRNLIRAIGGPKVVAQVLNCSGSAVSHWTEVPREHALVIESMARERKVFRSDGTPYTIAILRPDIQEALDRVEPGAPRQDITIVQED